MGNSQSFEQHQDFKDLQTNYTYEKKYNDSRFGEVKLLRENSTGQKVFQKDFSSNTPKEFQDYIEEIRDCSVLAHPNVLRIYGYNSKKEDLFCADFYKLSLFFESFESDLEQEIANRSHTKNYFPEKELWYILDSVASGCAFLQNNKIPHRDIRPYSVFITSSKDYKISATNLFRQAYNPGYFGHFDALEARSRYYSPELLKHFGTEEAHRKPIDEYKSDVFSLGMTMLEAASLERDHSVYNFDKFQVNQDGIRQSLERLKSRYSDNFVKTIQSTLDFNPETRLDFARLDRELGLYRRDIREQARGTGVTPSSPTKPDPTATHIRMGSPERHREAPTYHSDELDQRVREAVRKSEEVIKRSSPTKYANKNLDPYIQSYLRNDLHPQGQPILSQISPYLTSESKYTTTLTIEQPNYGRESQPINFGQPQASVIEQGEHIKRSGFADPSLGLPAHGQSPSRQAPAIHSGTSFGQPAAAPTYGVSTSGYGHTGTTYAHDFGTTATAGHGHGHLGQSGAGTGAGYITGTHYGVNAPYGAGTTHVATTNLTHSGVGAGAGGYGAHTVALGGSNLAHSGVGTTPGHAAYTHTSGAGDQSNRNYSGEADDLSRRIAERLQASKQLTH